MEFRIFDRVRIVAMEVRRTHIYSQYAGIRSIQASSGTSQKSLDVFEGAASRAVSFLVALS